MTSHPAPGLCGDCRHGEWLRSKRSRFLRCRKSESDAAYPRYPALPVLACDGYDPGSEHAPIARPDPTP